MNKNYRLKRNRGKKNKLVSSLQSVRFFIVLATILLFGIICLTALLLPEAKVLKDLLPYLVPLITLVFHHYFGRGESK